MAACCAIARWSPRRSGCWTISASICRPALCWGTSPSASSSWSRRARAAARGVKFLIFDEPTAYLTRQDTDKLFRLIRRLNGEGVTIVYISHRMEEIFQLADRVSVLRDGQLVADPCRGRDQ